jgi:uncharacterized protein related to proFAR isomerase
MKIIEDLNENSARCLYILLHNGADPSEIIDTEGDTEIISGVCPSLLQMFIVDLSINCLRTSAENLSF